MRMGKLAVSMLAAAIFWTAAAQAEDSESTLTKEVHASMHDPKEKAELFKTSLPADGKAHKYDADITAGKNEMETANVKPVDPEMHWDAPTHYEDVTLAPFKGSITLEEAQDGGYYSHFWGKMKPGGGGTGPGTGGEGTTDLTWDFYGKLNMGKVINLLIYFSGFTGNASEENKDEGVYVIKCTSVITELTKRYNDKLQQISTDNAGVSLLVYITINCHGNENGLIISDDNYINTDNCTFMGTITAYQKFTVSSINVQACSRADEYGLEYCDPDRIHNIYDETTTKDEFRNLYDKVVITDNKYDLPRRNLLAKMKDTTNAESIDGVLGPADASGRPDWCYGYLYSKFTEYSKYLTYAEVENIWEEKHH